MGIPGILKSQTSDVWSIAACRCPHCLEATEVLLTQVQLNCAPLGFQLFYIERSYLLTCKKCRYHKPIDPLELYGVARAKRLFRKFQAGELEAEEYWDQLRQVNFPSFKSFLTAKDLWVCDGCGEKSPPEMTACWQCNESRPGFDLDAESANLPPLPGPIAQSSHPWER